MSLLVPDASTVPTARRPLRLGEFDALFTASVRSVEQVDPTHLRLHLPAEAGVAVEVRDLTARASQCASFFAFTIAPTDAGGAEALTLDVGVHAQHVDVIDALAERATTVSRAHLRVTPPDTTFVAFSGVRLAAWPFASPISPRRRGFQDDHGCRSGPPRHRRVVRVTGIGVRGRQDPVCNGCHDAPTDRGPMSALQEALIAQLEHHRGHVLSAIDGLRESALDQTVAPSGWTLRGMVTHLLFDVEIFWMGAVLGGDRTAIARICDGWSAPSIPGHRLRWEYRRAAEIGTTHVRGVDLDAEPRWLPPPGLFGGPGLTSGLEVFLRALGETATHAGHMDMARERLDGHQHLVVT